MAHRRTGGPARVAGPLLHFGAFLLAPPRAAAVVALGACLLLAPAVAAALDWIPPPSVTVLLPSATLAPGSTHTLDLTVRSNGTAPRNLAWSASSSGPFVVSVSPSSGILSVPANGIGTVPLSVTVPPAVFGTASLAVTLTDEIGEAHVAKVSAAVQAATDGRPEVKPAPSTWAAPAGTTGSVAFQIRSMIAGSAEIDLTTGRFTLDPNNAGGVFGGSPASTPVILPAGGTITVNVPTTIPSRVYAGNAEAVQLSVTSVGGISNAVGHALASASLPDSLPSALIPVGVTSWTAAAAGRDGPTPLRVRGYWMIPSGLEGVRVLRSFSTDSIGSIDADGDGDDDRMIGTFRIPSYAAALDVVPGFVTAAGETLDVGLLAAGRGGLMLLDLRVVEDSPFGTWEDFFDVDMNGVDDRILRVIPTPGFATDAAWFRAASGRVVALVADADTGSTPVAVDYDPALTVPGSGAGVIAVDLGAAIDSLGSVPYAAGTLPTPGSALDLEVRGTEAAAELAVADGSGGVALYALSTAVGAPATVTFTPKGVVTLSSAWGPPDARDIAWISNTRDSVYLSVAAGGGGVQIIRAPRGAGAPSLALVQQTASPAIGVADAWTGTLGVAMGAGGVALMQVPGASELDRIGPAAPPPYTAPVVLARGQAWAGSGALERARHQGFVTSSTSLQFEPTAGPIPDLLICDGPRVLVLRPGIASITGVVSEGLAPAPSASIHLTATPNPGVGGVRILVSRANGVPLPRAVAIGIYDVRGRLVRKLTAPASTGVAKVDWDGRDNAGRFVAAGRYWLRLMENGRHSAPAASITLLR